MGQDDQSQTRAIKAIIFALLSVCVMAAGLAISVSPVSAQSSQQTDWYVNDDPTFHGQGSGGGWRGGDPASAGRGYGPDKSYGSNYAYAAATDGYDPTGSYARWDMGTRIGTQEIRVFIPCNHATARVRYLIDLRASSGGSSSSYTNWVNQADLCGRDAWHSLGNWETNGQRVTIEVRYNDSQHATGRTGAGWRSLGVDAIAMRCASNCTTVVALGSVTGLSYNSIEDRITWNPVGEATAYDVEWTQLEEELIRRSVLCSSSDGSLFGSKCGLEITPVGGKDVDFRVRAKNNGGTNFGPWSNWRVGVVIEPDSESPPASTVTGLDYSSGRIRWQPLSDATSYDVEWRNARERATRQQVTCSSSCSLSITRARHLELQFRVRARNSAGTGPWTRWVTSPPASAASQVITVRTDTVPGTYTVSWATRNNCNPGVGASGASGSMSRTVTGGRVEIGVVINDICAYDWSAGFVNADGATCQIAASSLRITNNQMTLAVAPNSCPRTGSLQVISILTDTVPGTYTVSWNTRNRCDPSVGGFSVDGASGSTSRTVTGGRVEIGVVINDICAYDWSAGFVNADGATCQIAASSLRITNNQMSLAVAPNSCPRTGSLQVISILTDTVPGTYTVSWATRNRCNPSVGGFSVDGASGSTSRTVTGGRVEIGVAINDICAYDWSAGFVNAAGAACRITPGSLRVVNNRINLAVEPGSCPTTGTVDEPTDEGLPPAMGDPAGSDNPPAATKPSAVRNLQLTLSDENSFAIAWEPPADDGGSPITGYLLRVSRPGWEESYSLRSRGFRINGLHDTTYTVWIVARNDSGGGPAVIKRITTLPPREPPPEESSSGGEPPPQVTDEQVINSVFGPVIYWKPVPGAIHYEVDARESPVDKIATRTNITCGENDTYCSYRIVHDTTTTPEFRNASMFRIRAHNDAGIGGWSAWATIPLKPVTGVEFRTDFFLGREVNYVIWAPVAGAREYEVKFELSGSLRRPTSYTTDCCSLLNRDTWYDSVRVRAVGATESGPWSALSKDDDNRPSFIGLRHEGETVMWNERRGTAAYDLEWTYSGYSQRSADDPRDGTAIDIACCSFRLPRNFGTWLEVRVRRRGVLTVGAWSAWTTVAHDASVQNLSYKVGPHVTKGIPHTRDTVSWDPVEGAESYSASWQYRRVSTQLRDGFERDELDHETKDANLEVHCVATRCQATFERTADFRTFVIRVTAERNGARTRVSWSERIYAPRCPSSSDPDRFEVRNGRVRALRYFRTSTHDTISPRQEGGKVDGEENLAQDSCAWIFRDAEVTNRATVSGNAIVSGNARVKDDAKIHGKAQVYGSAEVKDHAQVSGSAEVFGQAEVREHAWVRGNARVSGTAEITGDAVITGEVKIDEGEITEGTFDGFTEYVEMFVEIHDSVYNNIRSRLAVCKKDSTPEDVVDELVKRFIGLADTGSAFLLDEEKFLACIKAKAYRDAVFAVFPDWTFFLPYKLGAINTLKNLYEVAGTLKDNPYERSRVLVRELRTLHDEILKKKEGNRDLCNDRCKEKLKNTINRR